MSDTSKPSPKAERFGTKRPKAPPFARYQGTSAWTKDRVRVRAYARFRAAQKAGQSSSPASH